METKKYHKYEKALKHVRALKEFYQHLAVYVAFVIVLLLFKSRLISFILANTENLDPKFLEWIHINIILIPFIWGVAVVIHMIYVYRIKLPFFKDWEERRIQELMEEEDKNNTKNWE